MKAHASDYERMLREKKALAVAALLPSVAKVYPGRLGDDDQAQHLQHEFLSNRLNHLDYGRLRLIEEALDRLATGDYGRCLACDAVIPARRLQAVPWARYCVRCQEQADASGGTGELDDDLLYDHGGPVS